MLVAKRAFFNGASHSLFPSLHDKGVGALVVAGLVTLGRNTPGRARMAAAGAFSFTTAMRMVDRIHRNAAVGGPMAQPAITACLTDLDVLVIGIGELADGGAAARVDQA